MLEFLFQQAPADVMMAWVQFIPAAMSLISAGVGASAEAKKRRDMRRRLDTMQQDNENLYNADYYSDYTQRADVQNVIRQMRDEQQAQRKYDANKSAITGGTTEQAAALSERRNAAMSNLYRNIGAQGSAYKERAKERYLARKNSLNAAEYDTMAQGAESSSNLFNNALSDLGTMDWASILKRK